MFYVFALNMNIFRGDIVEESKANKNKIHPNVYSCTILFCIAALFEAAFLALTIQAWNLQSIVIYLGLAFALQIAACIKAICVWRIHRYPTESVAYIICAVIAGLIMYLTIEVGVGLAMVLDPTVLISLDSTAIALIDALLSVVLLYGIKSWLKVILKSEPSQLSNEIQHHFLFNTLNTTVCRIRENPELAGDNLERLADLYRKILALKIYISLEEELALVKCYLGIEKYRLGKRLQVSWLLNYEKYAAIKVPALILQPLVENAIHHGIGKIIGDGVVVISLCTVENRLIIQVCNPIGSNEYSNLSHRNGIAQTNIERRLALVYGDNFSFKRERCETEYRATINIPIGGLL